MTRLYEIPCLCSNCGHGLSHWDAKFCPACGTPQDNLIQKVDLIPFPFTLMKTSIFAKMKKPWFHCEIEYPTDSWFADRCIESGIQEYVHMGVRLNHRGVTDLTKPHLFNSELAKKQANAPHTLVGIGEEDMAKHQYILNLKMKEAEQSARPKPTMILVGENDEEDSNEQEESNIAETDGVKEVV